jgi:dipeptidyl aminopeptidase/acylaminoacyl peptidase
MAKTLTLLLTLGVAALALAGGASATGPVITTSTLTMTNVPSGPTCGAEPIMASFVADRRFESKSFYDGSTLVLQRRHVRGDGTIALPSTGVTLPYEFDFTSTLDLVAQTGTITGQQAHVIVPGGGGVVFRNSGILVEYVSLADEVRRSSPVALAPGPGDHGQVKKVAALAAVALLAAGCGSTHGEARPAQVHLVYLAGEDTATARVLVADADAGHPHSLGRGSAAVLTPDGKTVAVRRPDGIYLVSADGKRSRRLTPRRLHPEAWSPDGETLIATRPKLLAVLELNAIDRRTGRVRVLASGSLYGFDFSPDGKEIVYARAPVATGQGPCGDQFDVYVAPLAGGEPRRLTHDGLSGFPVWGPKGIAFSRFPAGSTVEDCSAPGIWTMDADGSHVQPVIARAPASLASNQLFGLQPLAWLDDEHVLTGVRTNSGRLGAVLDTKTRKLRELRDFVDEASSDGRYSVGSGGNGEIVHVAILRLSDGHRVFLRNDACCPDWNR